MGYSFDFTSEVQHAWDIGDLPPFGLGVVSFPISASFATTFFFKVNLLPPKCNTTWKRTIKKKSCEKQKVTFECTRQQLWLKKKTIKKPKQMYLYTQTANINFITVRINYFFNSQLVNSERGRGAEIFFSFFLRWINENRKQPVTRELLVFTHTCCFSLMS